MEKDEARAWMARWSDVERAEVAELQNLSAAMKLRQLDALAQSADLFDWSVAEAENEAVRALWVRLRKRYETV